MYHASSVLSLWAISTVTTSAAYDMLGRMISQTDENGNTTKITYNALSGITSKSVPLSIDTNGKITYNIVRYSYDNAGNVSYESVSGEPTTAYTYDHINRVVKAVTGSEAVSYTYGIGMCLLTALTTILRLTNMNMTV